MHIMPQEQKSAPQTPRNQRQKKRKQEKSHAPHPAETQSDAYEIGDEEFPIKCILDEDDTRYYIDWAGPYSPTWVSFDPFFFFFFLGRIIMCDWQ